MTYRVRHAQFLGVWGLDVRPSDSLKEALHVAAPRRGPRRRLEFVGRARRAKKARVVLEEVKEVPASELLPAGVAQGDTPRVGASLTLFHWQSGSCHGDSQREEERCRSKHAHGDGGGGEGRSRGAKAVLSEESQKAGEPIVEEPHPLCIYYIHPGLFRSVQVAIRRTMAATEDSDALRDKTK